MFGYDKGDLERIRKEMPPPVMRAEARFGYSAHDLDQELGYGKKGKKRLRWWVFALEMLVLLVGLTGVGGLWVLDHPEWIQSRLDLATADAKFTVSFADLEVLPVGTWYEPETWRFAVSDFRVTPRDPMKADVSIARIVVGLPDLDRLYSEQELHFTWARAVGLHIQAHQQRPPVPWQDADAAVDLMLADVVEVWGASYDAPADPPLGMAHIDRVYGDLQGLVYEPGRRELSAKGSLWAPAFTTGAITVTNLRIPELECTKSTARLKGTMGFGGTQTHVSATIADFHRKPTVQLNVSFKGAAVDNIVWTATGHKGPLVGTLDANLVVHSGGKLPRGGAWMEGEVTLTDPRIPLKADVSNVIKDIIRIAPTVKLSEDNQVVMGDMHGTLRLTRGTAVIKNLVYEANKREIQLRGHVAEDDLLMVMRLVPLKKKETRPGVGLVMYGTPQKYMFRLAKKEDLLPEVYGAEAVQDDRPQRVRKPLFVLGKKKKESEGVADAESEIDED